MGIVMDVPPVAFFEKRGTLSLPFGVAVPCLSNLRPETLATRIALLFLVIERGESTPNAKSK
jgi:hypothetical protein